MAKSIFVILRRVRGDQARKPLAGSVDDKEIAIGTIVPTQANVGTGSLVVSRVHLEQRGEYEPKRLKKFTINRRSCGDA